MRENLNNTVLTNATDPPVIFKEVIVEILSNI